jgi:hypothetical protein
MLALLLDGWGNWIHLLSRGRRYNSMLGPLSTAKAELSGENAHACTQVYFIDATGLPLFVS